jgi:uncharacterized lipoprotein
MKNKILLLIALMLLVSCNSQKDQNEITNTVKALYEKSNAYGNLTFDTKVYSESLNKLLLRTREVEILDKESVLKSKYPTDKPLLIEGDIFTSLYEGHTSYKIKNIAVEKDKATVIVTFYNKDSNTNWEDTLVFIKENGWKMDNVHYAKKSSLTETLTAFIKSYETQK